MEDNNISSSKPKNSPYLQSLNDIKKLLCKYSIDDVAESLFSSSIWLPNNSSYIKHTYVYSIFSTINEQLFSKTNKIKSYSGFKSFIQKLYNLIQPFPMLEDYLPEFDWGQVKYFYNKKNYKILYGTELSNVYDYMSLFQMLYKRLDEKFKHLENRSPIQEFANTLNFQNNLINNISSQPKLFDKIKPGHIEIPKKQFWEESIKYYDNINQNNLLSIDFKKTYSGKFGHQMIELDDESKFYQSAYNGDILPILFLNRSKKYYLIQPKRIFSIMFDAWTRLYIKYENKLKIKEDHIIEKLGGSIHRYVDARLNVQRVHPFASVIANNDSVDRTIFSSIIFDRNELVFIYISNPIYSKSKLNSELISIKKKIMAVKKILSMEPVRILFHLSDEAMEFKGKSKNDLSIKFLIILPNISTKIESTVVPNIPSAFIMMMDQFLGLIDSIDLRESLVDFLTYLKTDENKKIFPISSILDTYSIYKSMHGAIVQGAIEPSEIFIYPHSGSEMRYQDLMKFWNLFPEVEFYRNPRSWEILEETPTRYRLISKGFRETAIFCKINFTYIFINFPYPNLSDEQAIIANFLIGCIEHLLSEFSDKIKNHRFFRVTDQLQISIFPDSLVLNSDDFKHMRGLYKENTIWSANCGYLKPRIPGIRIVYSEKIVKEKFRKTSNRKLEVELLGLVLRRINDLRSDTYINSINDTVSAVISDEPKYTLDFSRKDVSFPDISTTVKPDKSQFVMVEKNVAIIALKNDIKPGDYNLTDAKTLLNKLRDIIIKVLRDEINKYGYDSVKYIIKNIDSLTNEYEIKKKYLELRIKKDGTFTEKDDFANFKKEFIPYHRDFRYLIEKFVQLHPTGKINLSEKPFKYLVALSDKLLQIYSVSDSIAYGIHPISISISDEYNVNIKYDIEYDKKQEIFNNEQFLYDLNKLGLPDDRIESPRPIEDYLAEIDDAFMKDLGFGLRNIISILIVMSQWGYYVKKLGERQYYSASIKQIEDVCSKNIKGLSKINIKPIIEFLSLKKSEVTKILYEENGSKKTEDCFELPVWEYKKRYARYTIRPIIEINDNYFWGPHSAARAGHKWSDVTSGSLPCNLGMFTINKCIDKEKKLIEKALETKAYEICQRFTNFAEKNVRLHRRDKEGNHPTNLGDYDVLAYIKESDILINIECGDILQAYSLKDLSGVKEKLFGTPGRTNGKVYKILRRLKYIKNNIAVFSKIMQNSIDLNKTKILTIFVSRRDYYWTRFPPKDLDIKFFRIDRLSEYLDEVINEK